MLVSSIAQRHQRFNLRGELEYQMQFHLSTTFHPNQKMTVINNDVLPVRMVKQRRCSTTNNLVTKGYSCSCLSRESSVCFQPLKNTLHVCHAGHQAQILLVTIGDFSFHHEKNLLVEYFIKKIDCYNFSSIYLSMVW